MTHKFAPFNQSSSAELTHTLLAFLIKQVHSRHKFAVVVLTSVLTFIQTFAYNTHAYVHLWPTTTLQLEHIRFPYIRPSQRCLILDSYI